MSALSVLGTNLMSAQMAPLTNNTGGTSVSSPTAGTGSGTGQTTTQQQLSPITGSDKAGAGILTFLVIVVVIFAAWWINVN